MKYFISIHPNTKTHNLLQKVGLIFSSRIVHLQTTIILNVQKSETTTIHRLYLTLFTYRDFPHNTRKSCRQWGTEYPCPASIIDSFNICLAALLSPMGASRITLLLKPLDISRFYDRWAWTQKTT